MPAFTADRSVVGVTSMLAFWSNDSRPTCRFFGNVSTNCAAAVLAASRRLGLTSVEAIDSDTSRAMMIVPRSFGTRVVCAGRATPITSRTRAATSPTAERWRCQPGRRGATDASRSTLVNRRAYFCRDRCLMM